MNPSNMWLFLQRLVVTLLKQPIKCIHTLDPLQRLVDTLLPQLISSSMLRLAASVLFRLVGLKCLCLMAGLCTATSCNLHMKGRSACSSSDSCFLFSSSKLFKRRANSCM